ncbi:hypothetical protein GUJ93_ZPchr0003g18114 [Zizania palustris]|uniref:Uncharacterized protein n=1 Tax=Zizania palustris TaxID=103762 RepID=A0A8J5VXK4_ZIZPA|nr:hypothetical protein GUJ93_ZPchr0003g18114 [Zizania palustris]
MSSEPAELRRRGKGMAGDLPFHHLPASLASPSPVSTTLLTTSQLRPSQPLHLQHLERQGPSSPRLLLLRSSASCCCR